MERDDERVQQGAIVSAAVASRGAAVLMGTALAVYIGRRGTAFEVGLVYAVYWFGIMAFSPVWGTIADLTGRRRGVLLGTGVFATLFVLPLSVFVGVWTSLAFRTIFAIFVAGFIPVMLTIVDAHGEASNRGRALGIFNSAVAGGLLFGRFFSGVLLQYLTRESLFLAVTGISGVVVLAALVIKDPTHAVESNLSRSEFVAEVRDRLFPAAGDREHLRTNGLRWLYVATFLRNMSILGIGSLIPIYILRDIGISELFMGILLTVNPALQIAFMYSFGHLADRFGRKPLIAAGLAGSGVYSVLIGLAAFPATTLLRVGLAVVSFLLLALGFSAMKSGSVAFIGDVAPTDRESELMGLRETARGFGGVVGPVVFGTAATFIGYATTFVVGSVFSFAGAVLVFLYLRESHPEMDA